ncbi:hypothetical protein [Kosakonia quasisacchari]|uniref:hypothetical protein n=1 Tax=Kosakonia quasisacchari TaxID=2529380 RepID=UPI0039DFA3A9
MENAPVTASTPKINGVDISYLTATNADHAMIFSGLSESAVRNVSLQHIHIAAKYGARHGI